MIQKKNLLGLAALAVLAASCRPKVNYECRCYNEGVHSHTYEIGRIDNKLATERCHAMQQQNGEDTCQAAAALK